MVWMRTSEADKGGIFSPNSKFAGFMNVLADVLLTGILWIICSIPIFTATASAAAAYYAMAKCARRSSGRVFHEFFRSFRLNFKQSLFVGIPFALAVGLTVLDIFYLWNNSNSVNDALFIAMLLVAFTVLGLFVYYPPMLSRFSDTNLNILRMAAQLMFRYLPLTIGVIVLFALFVAGVWLMPWTILFLPGIFIYIITFPLEKILHKISPDKEENIVDEDEKSWYNR